MVYLGSFYSAAFSTILLCNRLFLPNEAKRIAVLLNCTTSTDGTLTEGDLVFSKPLYSDRYTILKASLLKEINRQSRVIGTTSPSPLEEIRGEDISALVDSILARIRRKRSIPPAGVSAIKPSAAIAGAGVARDPAPQAAAPARKEMDLVTFASAIHADFFIEDSSTNDLRILARNCISSLSKARGETVCKVCFDCLGFVASLFDKSHPTVEQKKLLEFAQEVLFAVADKNSMYVATPEQKSAIFATIIANLINMKSKILERIERLPPEHRSDKKRDFLHELSMFSSILKIVIESIEDEEERKTVIEILIGNEWPGFLPAAS